MTPLTRTQRQAAAKKAAATRKRNSARQSSQTAKASVRRTTTSAQSTGRAARRASKQAGWATAGRVLAETRFEAVARQAERVILIPVGATLEAHHRVAATIRTYSDSRLARQQLNRFERRGATVLRRKRRAVERQAEDVRDSVESRANGVQSRANDLVERVLSLS